MSRPGEKSNSFSAGFQLSYVCDGIRGVHSTFSVLRDISDGDRHIIIHVHGYEHADSTQ